MTIADIERHNDTAAMTRTQRSFRSMHASLSPSPTAGARRKSVQIGAPAIGFRPIATFERGASQPTLLLVDGHLPATATDDDRPKYIGSEPAVTRPARNILTKRVSWMSMKSLEECGEPLLAAIARGNHTMAAALTNHRDSSPPLNASSGNNSSNANRSDSRESRTGSQYGSMLQLDEGSVVEFDDDTPPLDTLSWSNAGQYMT
jgi:hypothetical protein